MGLHDLINNLIDSRKDYGNEKHKHISAVIRGTSNKPSVLATGYNHSVKNGVGPIHAEMDALRKYSGVKHNNKKGNGGKVSIVVARTNGGNSRPCMQCILVMATLFYARVKNVYYTTDDGIQKETLGSLKNNCTAHISLNNRRRLKIGVEDEEEDESALEGKRRRLKMDFIFAPNRLEPSNIKVH